jgi:Phage capsid family
MRPARPRASKTLVRSVIAQILSQIDHHRTGAEAIARAHWPQDESVPLLLKAAVSPASMTGSGWANTLVQTAISDFIVSLGPASAASELFKRGIQLKFGQDGAIQVPGVVNAASNVTFIGEAGAIPVRQFTFSGPTLSPRKLPVIATFTRETFLHSTPTIEALVRVVLAESLGLALDTLLLDAVAGDAVRPAGLRAGISALASPAVSTLTPANEAMFADLRSLAGAVGGVAGSAPIIFVMAPRQALSFRTRTTGEFPYEVLSSSGLADTVVVAIASNALVSAADPSPRVDVSGEGTLHFEDSAPLQIGTVGAPATVAAPTRNLFQNDLIGVRLIFEISWALRTSGALSWYTGVSW